MDCTSTDNQKQRNKTLHTPKTQKNKHKNPISQTNLRPGLVLLLRSCQEMEQALFEACMGQSQRTETVLLDDCIN